MLRPYVFVVRAYFLVDFSFFESLLLESFDDSLDEESLEEESLESLESFDSFLSDEDFSSLAASAAGDFPA